MRKQIAVVLALIAVGAALFASNYIFLGTSKPELSREITLPLPAFSLESFKLLPANDAVVAAEAWTVFQNYLEFARTHNLEGMRKLSHQLSTPCSDPVREPECFVLMDSVYALSSTLRENDFKHIYYDDKQIVMLTDGPIVAVLYFTKDESSATKVLGMRFCAEEEGKPGSCSQINSNRTDTDGNGWWDVTESLFY